MHCEDLSPYHYGFPTGLPGTFSVGWLDRSVTFPTGDVASHVIDTLLRFAQVPNYLTRGSHMCQFCEGAEPATGHGELWLRYRDGPIYVSPSLLPHYIRNHAYLPPAEFLGVFDREVELVPESESDVLMRSQSTRLRNRGRREDILVDLYVVEVIWQLECFRDLLSFKQHIDSIQRRGTHFPVDHLRRCDEGYCLNLECRDPVAFYNDMLARHDSATLVPHMCRCRLVYLNEPWDVVVAS